MAAAVGEAPASFVDLGTGGGVPGLPLQLTWPRARGILVESRRQRCRFLTEALSALHLADRAEVECGRAEALARRPDQRQTAELVVARSFGPPAVTAECAVAFLAPGGLAVIAEPPDPEASRWPDRELAALGFTLEGTGRAGAFGFARLRRRGPLDERWPRRMPAKRPLWS